MRDVVMQNAELDSKTEATKILVKVLDSTYAKADLKHVADNANQMNAEERIQLLRLLGDFEDLFDGTLGDWDTDPVNMEINPGSKPFNSKYYPVPRLNKGAFCKELKLLAKIVVLTPVHQSQYGTPIFIIPKKEGTVRFITYYFRLNQKSVRNPYS